MMNPGEFDAARQEICASGSASDGDNLLGMEMDFCGYLGDPASADEDPGLWHEMSVSRAEESEWLIAGCARGRRQDAQAIGAELSRRWLEKLRYGFREAHTIVQSDDEVALLAVTQIGLQGLWVTAAVRVELTNS